MKNKKENNIIDFVIAAQINVLESLKIDYYNITEGIGGSAGDNYVGLKQITKKINSLKKKLNND